MEAGQEQALDSLPWGSTDGGPQEPDKPLANEVVYKVTSNSDIVVPRRVVLFNSRFYTYHEMHGDADKRKWPLDRHCKLEPKDAADIASSKKMVRPQGTWTITATVRGAGEPRELYLFKLHWSGLSWAAKGYASFTFGFANKQQAIRWHGLLSQCIDMLRNRHAAQHASKRRTVSSVTNTNMDGGSIDSRSTSLQRGQEYDVIASLEGTPVRSPFPVNPVLVNSTTLQQSNHSILAPLRTAREGSADTPGSRYYEPEDIERPSMSSLAAPTFESGSPAAPMTAGGTSSDDEDDDMGGSHRTNKRHALHMRWVPYKQANGLSIYYHIHDTDDTSSVGGEYMVSAVVHAPPKQVLDVLMHGTNNTTIVGPARKMEVLECSRMDANTTKELVRLVIEAPGWAGVFCAPREVVVERMCKTDESKCYVVMFNTSEDLQLKCKAYCPGYQLLKGKGGHQEAAGQAKTRESQDVAGGQRMRRGLWRQPVPCNISGAYTISCLKHHTLASSHECLVTCMVKVDLRGAIAANSWSGALCDLFGWRDAFLDRILTNVILVRDEVEQRRFKEPPQVMQHASSGGAVMLSSGSTTTLVPPTTPGPAPSAHASMLMSASGRHRTFHTSMTMANRVARTGEGSATQPPTSGFGAVQLTSTTLSSTFLPSPREEPRQSMQPLPGVGEEGMEGGEAAVPMLDYESMATLSSLDHKFWSQLHTGDTDAPFVVRGPTYLKDKKKIPAGNVQFAFAAMDMIELPYAMGHVARFLPSVRSTGMPFGIIINLIIPGTPLLGIVATFATEQHPASVLQNPPSDPMEEGHNWQPFDFVMHKFYTGSPATRNKMLKLIPHIAEGSWMIKSSVGTTPVILGKALKTTYHETPQYIEIDIDISANNVAAYVTGLVRGATKSLVIDMGFVLEGTAPWELPENLLGTLRLHHLDIKQAKKIDVSKELPLVPPRYASVSGDVEVDGASPQSVPHISLPGKDAVESPHRPNRNSFADQPGSPHSMGGQSDSTHVQGGSPLMHRVASSRRAALGSAGPAGMNSSPSASSLLQTVNSGNHNLPTTTFGMRHRGHTRTPSNCDSHASAVALSSAVPNP